MCNREVALPRSRYAQALRDEAGLPSRPYDYYSRPSMYPGPVGPVPAPPTIPVPTPIGILPGYRGDISALKYQGVVPREHPAGPYAPEGGYITWADVVKRRDRNGG